MCMIFVSIAQGWFMDDNTGVEQFVEEFAKAHKDIFELDQVRCGLRTFTAVPWIRDCSLLAAL